MIDVGTKSLEVVVDYGSSCEKQLAGMKADDHVRQIIEQKPVWQFLPRALIPSGKLSVEVVLFHLDDKVASMSRVFQRMSGLGLRPTIFAEFTAVLNSLPATACQATCLGSFWCPVGSPNTYRLLALENGVLKLQCPRSSFKEGLWVPSINYDIRNRRQRLPMMSGL